MTVLLTFSSMRNEGADGADAPLSGADLGFDRCVERLEELIEAETRILKSCQRVDFDALNLRKSHALLELMRVARNRPPKPSAQTRRRLGRLVARLAENIEILGQHLQAMQQITTAIVESIRAVESDGTYSRKMATRR